MRPGGHRGGTREVVCPGGQQRRRQVTHASLCSCAGTFADCFLLSRPSGLEAGRAESAVATATGPRPDQRGATDLLTLLPVQPGRLITVDTGSPPPPVAHASGSHTLTLPNNSLVLRGSVTDGDQTAVRFLWVRDRQSPAAGVGTGRRGPARGRGQGSLTLRSLQDVLYASDRRPSLHLANLVQGTYLFQLQVTDALGRSSSAAATVEVRPGGGGAPGRPAPPAGAL